MLSMVSSGYQKAWYTHLVLKIINLQWRIQDLWKGGGGGRESKFLDAAPENRPK